MLKVLMVSDVYFPRVNGVSTSIASFRRALSAQGVDVRLVVPRYGREADEEGVIRIPGWRLPLDPEDRLVARRAMYEAVRREARDCDLVHVQTPFVAHYAGLAAARACGRPVLLTYHTLFEEYLQHYIPFLPAAALRGLARRISRQQCDAVDQVIVPSTAMRTRLADYGVRTPMEVLPTGIPVADFARGDGAHFRRIYDIPEAAQMALFIGRVAHEKNIGFLLDVAARLRSQRPGFVLVIAGEGPATRSLQRRATQLGLGAAVRFVGYLERRKRLPDCYAAADVFVFASRTETQGLVLLEAMAAGLPVVALAAMGTTDILAPERGARIAPDSPAGFAAVVEDVLANGRLRKQLAAEAPAYAAEWADTLMAARLTALYRRLLEGGGDCSPVGAAQAARG
ncbi:glycosyltransferase [Thauera mechernichensis]|uniref:Glycosyltransferase n=1 Tax=Thauera mechernichensis TaxID=82788 RepID=A0ABW3WD55_9RHOO|nr:glycosyltransferase [Thauera mechernichensis]MDG3065748.1 glycosyltransferase [Thauera mechernichensis]